MLRALVLCLLYSTARAGDHGGKPTDECVLNELHQSPIAIETSDQNRVPFDKCGGELDLNDYDKKIEFKAENTGYTVDFFPPENLIGISGANLQGTYKLSQFHFHWGSVDSRGSEHTLQGERYALECHFVHEGAENVAGNKTLAVVAVLFKSGDENPALEKLLTVFDDIKIPGDTELPTVPDFALIDLLPEGKQYYRYMGSLTTPPCTETVVWTVMHETRQVSPEQMDKFRTLLDPSQHHIQDNYRDLQQIGNRHVFCCGCDTISAAQNVQIGKSWFLIWFSVMIFVMGSLTT